MKWDWISGKFTCVVALGEDILVVHCANPVHFLTVQHGLTVSVLQSFHTHKHRSHNHAQGPPEHMLLPPWYTKFE